MPHEVACRTLAEGLIRLGIITQTLEEALDMENGHLRSGTCTILATGLVLTFMMSAPPSQMERHDFFEAGMVLTVEPGCFGAWRPDVDCPERYAHWNPH